MASGRVPNTISSFLAETVSLWTLRGARGIDDVTVRAQSVMLLVFLTVDLSYWASKTLAYILNGFIIV